MKKRFVVLAICAIIAIAIIMYIGSNITTGIPVGDATVSYRGTEFTLTDEEAAEMQQIFAWKVYNRGIGGCPFNENTAISFGETVFAIATDDCYSAKDMRNELCIEFDRDEFQKIIALYEKYFGDTVID